MVIDVPLIEDVELPPPLPPEEPYPLTEPKPAPGSVGVGLSSGFSILSISFVHIAS